MKITTLILLWGCLHVSAVSLSQTITLKVKEQSLVQIFDSICVQTQYKVIYSDELIQAAKLVTVSAEGMPLEEFLKGVLTSRALTYTIKGKTILIRHDEVAEIVNKSIVQQRTITGKVTNNKGLPFPGVNVRLKDVGTGIVTNSQGRYRIKVPNANTIMVFSYVGFGTVEKPVGINDTINVTLSLQDDKLSEVVVVGYGTTTKKDLTAAVSSISQESLSERTIVSLADAMRGKAAGVQITQNDGTPGSSFTFRIRGASSISAGSTPLFVIDGVLQDNADNISPGDIKSIDILKDASGTAMYGARGANGVVLLTTKTGQIGLTKLEAYSNIAWQKPGHLYKVMDAQQYAHARYLASAYVFSPPSATDPDVPATKLATYTYYRDTPLGTSGGFWGVNTDATYHNWQNYNSPDSVNTDWQDAMFQNSLIQEYRLNISGGNEKTKFSLLGGYLGQGGLVVFSDYKRYTGRFNLEQKLSPKITMNLNLSGGQTATNGFVSGTLNGGISSNAIVTAMLNKPPNEPLNQRDIEDNSEVDNYITTNPYSLAKYTTNKRYPTDWLTRMAFDFVINKNFTYRITGTYGTTNTNTDAYYPKFTAAGTKYNGRAYLSRATTTKFMNEHLLYYKNSFGQDHRLNAVLGATFEKQKTNLITAENQNYDIETLGVYGLENGTVPIIPTYDITSWTMASFLGRAEYTFKGKYLFTGTFRADGSSRFSAANKWGYFPSAALAWRVTDEEFMKNVSTISNLKLRASVGQSGNTAIPSYLTLSTIGTYFSPMDGNTPNYGVVVEHPENLSLKWETTTQVNGGLDLGLFKERVSITAEWYLKHTKDLLIQKVTPGYTGYRNTWTNLGSVQNSGVELDINAVIIEKPSFVWNVEANIGYNRSKAINIGPEMGLDPGVISGIGNSAIIRNGEPIGQWYGYKTEGIYQSYEEILASGLTNINGQNISTVRPGSRRFIDQNGDHAINADDRVILGQGQPAFTGGLTNMLRYKAFSLNAVIVYSYGNKIYNANRTLMEQARGPNNMAAAVDNAWRPSLYDISSGKLIEQGNPTNIYRMPNGPEELLLLSDFVEDGSFIRLSDLTLSYDFEGKLLSRYGLRGISIFASGKNLWISTKYKGYDPEVNTRQGNFGDLMPSLDYASYPRSRMYSIGLKVNL